ncbi:Plasmodium exported protein, unknown function [Plasmodium vivax]|uniref:Variable surface protein n=1 Tax=Plasmodium vivax TaxID=5855 RepID=A0A565A6A4_PLAVI|nr:Plasmodium exported protein, unknown function [Plasmodium vivax]
MLFFNLIRNCLEYGKKLDISLDLRPHRLLTKYEEQNELMNTRLQYKTNDNRQHQKLINGRDNNTYEKLKRGKPNNVEAYLNSFKYRHSKKSGLKKLDCYCEKKLFNSFNKIVSLAEEKKFSKKRIKKILYKKYGIPFIIISLLPLLVIIFPIMVDNGNYIKHKCKITIKNAVNGGEGNVYSGVLKSVSHEQCTTIPHAYTYLNNLFFVTLAIIIVSFIIYAYIKFNKYQRIRSGMSK